MGHWWAQKMDNMDPKRHWMCVLLSGFFAWIRMISSNAWPHQFVPTKIHTHTVEGSTAVAIYYGLLNTNANCESKQIKPSQIRSLQWLRFSHTYTHLCAYPSVHTTRCLLRVVIYRRSFLKPLYTVWKIVAIHWLLLPRPCVCIGVCTRVLSCVHVCIRAFLCVSVRFGVRSVRVQWGKCVIREEVQRSLLTGPFNQVKQQHYWEITDAEAASHWQTSPCTHMHTESLCHTQSHCFSQCFAHTVVHTRLQTHTHRGFQLCAVFADTHSRAQNCFVTLSRRVSDCLSLPLP